MKRWLAGAMVFVVALLLYAPTVRYGFTGWDDTAYIVNNPHVTSASEFGRIWSSPESEQYYPLAFSSYWLEYRLWGGNPAGYHATNVVLHALNALLVLLVLRALGLPLAGAVVGALLFAVHPLQVMSVAWVAERKNLLACLFTLLTLLAWMRSQRGGSQRHGFYALALVAFVAALLSKTVVLGLPVALAQLDLQVSKRTARATVLRVIPMLLLSVAAALVTVVFEEKFVDRTASSAIPDLAQRFQISGAAPWFYLGKLALPIGLAPAYPLWNVGFGRLWWWAPLSVTCASALAGVLLVARARGEVASRLAWGLAFFMILLAPSLGLIPFGNLALTYVSDHFVYIAVVGISAAAGLAFVALRDRAGWISRATTVVAVTIGVLLSIATLAYSPVFHSAESMWSRVVALNPDSYAGNLGLAEVLTAQGRVADAVPRYERAIASRPGATDAYLLLGDALKRTHDPAGAAARFRRALELAPGNVDAIVGLASASEQTGAVDEALALYQQAVRLAPRMVPARMGLGAMDLGFARPAQAREQFEAVIELRPDYPRGYLGAATALRSLSLYDEAAHVLRRGLARAPEDPPLLNLLALTLATAPDDGVRNGAEAVALAEHACAANGSESAELLDTLAAAYAQAQRFDDAVRTSQRAEAAAAEAGQEPHVAESRRRTDLYRNRAPLRLGR